MLTGLCRISRELRRSGTLAGVANIPPFPLSAMRFRFAKTLPPRRTVVGAREAMRVSEGFRQHHRPTGYRLPVPGYVAIRPW
ncbi:MAG TPA: hypothetical protein DCM14_00030 [Clostridiales bacterium UBA8153]|nr:hypothetical protein [Clostridiales bacterium UBA8153]